MEARPFRSRSHRIFRSRMSSCGIGKEDEFIALIVSQGIYIWYLYFLLLVTKVEGSVRLLVRLLFLLSSLIPV
jgi:hypothetical protein